MAIQGKTLLDVRTFEGVADLLYISAKQLNYLLYSRNSNAHRYRNFDLPKRRGGLRSIQEPRRELKYIQRNLAGQLYKVYRPRNAVQGFRHGKNVKSNAELHCPARYIFNVDLKDFFPSINFGRVRGVFLTQFSLPHTVATVLAQICCHENSLPQGAPTSPVLSNIICSRMDGELTRLAKKYRCFYSRYVDDITFSKRTSDFPPEIGYAGPTGGQVGPELDDIIRSNDFNINEEKVYLQSNRRRQRVTGLIINQKPNVPRRYVRQIRAMINAWSKYGEEVANRTHAEIYYRRTVRNGMPPALSEVIHGKLEFLKMVKGAKDRVYQNLQKRFVKIYPKYLGVMQKENSHMSTREVFISHASEDKDSIAKPLADALVAAGHSVWYDEYEIQLGDSLLQKINDGLAHSRFGVVILSDQFFSKNWTKKNLMDLQL